MITNRSFIKRKTTILLAVLFTAAALPQSLSLTEAVQTALKNNWKIKQYNEKYEQKKYENLEGWGNFLPKIDLTASYNHLNDPITFDLGPIREALIQMQSKNQVEFANIYNLIQTQQPLSDRQRAGLFEQYSHQLNGIMPQFTEELKKQDYKTATIIGIQPLFMGGKLLAAKKYASDEKQFASLELLQMKNQIINETVQNYIRVVFLKDVLKTRTQVLSGIKKHRDKAKKMLSEGLIANYHVLRAEVAVADAEKNVADDKNNLEVALLALKNSLGIGLGSIITINDSLTFSAPEDSLDNLINDAMSHQPVLKMLKLKRDAAKQKYNVERSSFLPTVAAYGKYEMYPQYLSALEPRWALGIQASINLFNGFKKYAKLQSASHLEDEIKFLEADTKSKIGLLINKNYKDIQSAKEQYEKTEAAIKLAQENLRLNNKRFGTGLGTSLEVVDAELSLQKSEIESKLALYNYYTSLSSLYLSTGDPQKVVSIWNNKENK